MCPELISSATPNLALASPLQASASLATTESECCLAYEDHIQQSSLPSTASVNDRTLGPWVRMMQQPPLQIQEHRLPMPRQSLEEAPDSSSFESANPADCTLIDLVPPISHTCISVGYSAPSDSTMQSPNTAQSAEKSHCPGLDASQILASVPEWYAEQLATAIQLKWPPLYTCTEDPPILNMHQDQASQPLSIQRPHRTYASQLPQYTTVAGQISESFNDANLWKHGVPADYSPADHASEVGAIYPTVDTQQKERHPEKLCRTSINNGVELITSQAYCLSDEHHPAICAPIFNHSARGSFAHVSYV